MSDSATTVVLLLRITATVSPATSTIIAPLVWVRLAFFGSVRSMHTLPLHDIEVAVDSDVPCWQPASTIVPTAPIPSALRSARREQSDSRTGNFFIGISDH